MAISKKFVVYIIAVIIILAGIFMLSKRLDTGDDDIMEHIARCGLSSANGEALAIRQGTVGRVSEISIGLKSIQDGKANIQLWKGDANISKSVSISKLCESVDFEGYTLHVLAIEDNPENPFGMPGSGSDSVKIFIEERQILN